MLHEEVAYDSLNLPDEMELQSLWFSGHFGTEFKTTEGENVKITQFGFWNKSSGADFTHCSISIQGVSHEGEIELDISAKHWTLHGHNTNPDFNSVILHVAFQKNSKQTFIKTLENKNIPSVIIPIESIKSAMGKTFKIEASAHCGRCSTPLERATLKNIENILLSAAKFRMHQKAKKYNTLSRTHGKDQALWVAIAETLGYRQNTFAFHTLAQRLPIKQLRTHTAKEIQAIIFGASGFLHPNIHEKAEHDSKEWLEDLWITWWQIRQNYQFSEQKQLQWKLAGSRPVNHPQRRLAALASVAANWGEMQITEDFSQIKEALGKLADPFWNHHYTLTSKRSKTRLALIGKSRIEELFTNHLIPAKISYADRVSWQHYMTLKAPVISEKVNRASIRLFGERADKESFLKKAWHHQALLQIYQDFCLEHISGCEQCPFPEKLKKWAEEDSDYIN